MIFFYVLHLWRSLYRYAIKTRWNDTMEAFSIVEKFDTQEEVLRWIKQVGIRYKVNVIITR